MTEEEDFQFVVSRQDYHNLKESKAKYQELAKLKAEVEELHMQDNQKYLAKIEKLQDELKSYRNSIRQYTEIEIQQIDKLIKVLKDYRSAKTQTNVEMISLNKIKAESDKIAQTYNNSLKDFEILNSQVRVVLINLVKDSLSLHEKLKDYADKYENVIQQRQELYVKVRAFNEKSITFDRQKETLIKNQQKLKYQNEFLKQSLKQKQQMKLQLEINLENVKNKIKDQARALKEETDQNEKRWREKLEMRQKSSKLEVQTLKKQKQSISTQLRQELDNLKNKMSSLSKSTSENDKKLSDYQQSNAELSQNIQSLQKEYIELQKMYDLNEQVIRSLRAQIQRTASNSKAKFASQEQKIKQVEDLLDSRNTSIQEKEMQIHVLVRENESLHGHYQQVDKNMKRLHEQLDKSKKNFSEIEKELIERTQKIKKLEEQLRSQQFKSHQLEDLKQILPIYQEQKLLQDQSLQALKQENQHLKKIYESEKHKLFAQSQEINIRLRMTNDNLEKLKHQNNHILACLNQVKAAKNKVEDHCCKIEQSFRIQILKMDYLRNMAQNGQRIQQSSNLMKMNFQTLQAQVERLNKERFSRKKQLQQSLSLIEQAKQQNFYLTDETNNLKQYIEELQMNLQKLSQQKCALKNEITLFKQQAEYCKRQSIQQLGIIDKLERELESVRKQLKNIEESIEPSSIVRRSSLSKGQKSYYVKEMIMEYGSEMKKNLLEIGSLSHEEIKELIVSELRELAGYIRRLQGDFQ